MNRTDVRHGILGVLAALLSIVFVMGSLVLSLAEGGVFLASALKASPTVMPAMLTQSVSDTPVLLAATSMVTSAISQTPLPTPSVTPSPFPPTPPASCPPPDGWSPITVKIGDTLSSLAQIYNISESLLAKANCLVTGTIIAGTTLYVPGLPTPLPPIVCGPPPGWVFYIVQSGDTLYSLSLVYDVTVAQLQLANCLGTSTTIRAGQRLYVPFYIAPTATRTPTLAPSATFTVLPSTTATNTPTFTSTYPVGFTPAFTSTQTFTPTPTATSTVTATATATATASATATATFTFTPLPTETSTLTPSATPVPALSPSP